ncbi:hypothetical protein CSUI_011589, partial [Cystoisospora suis]
MTQGEGGGRTRMKEGEESELLIGQTREEILEPPPPPLHRVPSPTSESFHRGRKEEGETFHTKEKQDFLHVSTTPPFLSPVSFPADECPPGFFHSPSSPTASSSSSSSRLKLPSPSPDPPPLLLF